MDWLCLFLVLDFRSLWMSDNLWIHKLCEPEETNRKWRSCLLLSRLFHTGFFFLFFLWNNSVFNLCLLGYLNMYVNSVCKAGWLFFEWLIRLNGRLRMSCCIVAVLHRSVTNSELVCSKSPQLVCGIADEIVCPQRLTLRSVTDLLPHAGASPTASLPRLSRSLLRGSQNLEAFCFRYHNAWHISLECNSARPVAVCLYTKAVLRHLQHNLLS